MGAETVVKSCDGAGGGFLAGVAVAGGVAAGAGAWVVAKAASVVGVTKAGVK